MGTTTRWTKELEISCAGASRVILLKKKAARREKAGQCSGLISRGTDGAALDRGLGRRRMDENRAKEMGIGSKDMTIGHKMKITGEEKGVMTFRPVTEVMPITSGAAHIFRELCLNVLAHFPELVGRQAEGGCSTTRAPGRRQTPHFRAGRGDGRAHHAHMGSDANAGGMDATGGPDRACGSGLPRSGARKGDNNATSVDRQDEPTMGGRRRWAQTRAKYKKHINQTVAAAVMAARERIQGKLAAGAASIAAALNGVAWKKIYRMQGVTAYQTQNKHKLKVNRLRIWAGPDAGFQW
jgi:hypothetical protein